MKIPTQFNLLGHTIMVKIDNEYCNKNECFGRFLDREETIIISDKYKYEEENEWKELPESVTQHTFHHELAHCILYYSGEKKLWLNERLVEVMGGLYHQYETSKI